MQLGIPVSPVRPLRPSVEASSPAVVGATRQTAALRRLAFQQPPSSPTRQLWQPHNVPPSPYHQQAARERAVATPASTYTSRQGSASESAARREDDEHSSTQLILLLTLSVMLLTLPWVVDHPITLLVPVALLILPFTSGALRSICYEGFSLVSGGVRWFWRHRKTGSKSQSRSTPQAAYQSWQQPSQPGSHVHTPERGFSTLQPRQAPRNVDHRAASQPLGVGPLPNSGSEAVICEWQPASMRSQPVASHSVAAAGPGGQLASSAADFTTPDLDFDSESEGDIVDAAGRQQPLVTAMQEQRFYQDALPRQRVGYEPRKQPDAAECTVHNWDAAEECTQRRKHRPLSELMSNGQ